MLTAIVRTPHGDVPVPIPSGLPLGEQCNILNAVSALAKLTPEQQRIAIEAVKERRP